jgi:hypothetical protein
MGKSRRIQNRRERERVGSFLNSFKSKRRGEKEQANREGKGWSIGIKLFILELLFYV